MALTDRQIQALAPTSKQLRVGDRDGLSLIVTPTGTKLWALQFRWNGKATQITLGRYSIAGGQQVGLGLKEARDAAAEARKLIEKGLHPGLERRAEAARAGVRQGLTFEAVAREWLDQRSGWTDGSRKRAEYLLENYLFPKLGPLPVAEVDSGHLMPILAKVAKSGLTSMPASLRTVAGQVMRYAIAARYAQHDPTAPLRGLVAKHRTTHFSTLRVDQLPQFRERMAGLSAAPDVLHAIRLLSLTAVRTKEVRFARWGEFERDVWTIPAERMKSRRPHVVPLSRQAVEVLQQQRMICRHTVEGYVFPALHISGRTRATQVNNPARARKNPVIGEKTINAALDRAGYKRGEFSGHGFRGTFSTAAHEAGWPHLHIEMQLAHTVAGVSASYNHALYLEPRRRMMQWWADLLDGVAEGSNVLEFPAQRAG